VYFNFKWISFSSFFFEFESWGWETNNCFFFFKDFLNTFHMAEKFKFLQVTYLIVYVYISPDISKLRSLEILDLTDNNLSNNIISSLSGLPRLKSLDLSFNNLKGSLDISGEYFYLNYISSSSLAWLWYPCSWMLVIILWLINKCNFFTLFL